MHSVLDANVESGQSFDGSLAALLTRRFPHTPSLGRVERLSGGASQETWAVEALGPEAARQLILRRAGGDTRHFAVTLETEADVIRVAAKHGIPVANVAVTLDPSDGLGSGFVMDRVAGETIPRKILSNDRFKAARDKMARDCGTILAGIHAIPVSECPALPSSGVEARLSQLKEQYLDLGHRRPVFDYAFNWLRANKVSEYATPRLVHGDFRVGNLIVEETGVRAVLDWELCHLGDPAEDIGWLCVPSWRFGNVAKPVGGVGSLDALLDGYRARCPPPEEARIRYWTIFGALFWGVMCVSFACEFRDGDRSVERAAIGRRASETELDLLWLINGGD